MSRHLLYIMVAAGTLLTSCKPTVPSKYIQPDEMEDLLCDIHIAQSMADQNYTPGESYDFNQTLYFAAALEKHGVTKAEFDSSLIYYYVRADRFNEMYKNITKRLTDQAMDLGASEGEVNRYSKLNANGDTADVWTGRLSVMLVPYAPYNRMSFVQKADTSFRKGDSFLFIINSDFIYQSGMRSAEACIAMKYDNDTIVNRSIAVTTSGMTEIRIPILKDRTVKEIRGYIYMNPEKEATTTLKLMAVKDIQLIKFRRKQEEEKNDSVAGIKKLSPLETN